MRYVFLDKPNIINDSNKLPQDLGARLIGKKVFVSMPVNTLFAMSLRIDELLLKYASKPEFLVATQSRLSPAKQVLNELGIPFDSWCNLLAIR